MRRAIIATGGTVVGLVLLLGYKSSDTVGPTRTPVGAGPVATSPVAGSLPGTPATGSLPETPATGSLPETPATGGATTTPPTSAADRAGRYTGSDVQYRYGDLEVSITVAAGRITDLSIVRESSSDPRSQSINSQAVPILTREALAAQSVRFDVVSGATFTSDAFAQSLQSALDEAET